MLHNSEEVVQHYLEGISMKVYIQLATFTPVVV